MIDELQQDAQLVQQLLAARRTVTVETLPIGMRLLWQMYLTILEDALSTLHSLINYLSARK